MFTNIVTTANIVNSSIECVSKLQAVSRVTDMIEARLEELRLRQTDLAERLGLTRGYISKIINEAPQSQGEGTHKIAIESGDSWATALEFTGEERARFLDEIALAHAPEEAQLIVERLRKDLLKKRLELDDVTAHSLRLAQKLAECRKGKLP